MTIAGEQAIQVLSCLEALGLRGEAPAALLFFLGLSQLSVNCPDLLSNPLHMAFDYPGTSSDGGSALLAVRGNAAAANLASPPALS